MTMMDTRVGPGADISDEDLDFAVGVKLRLDAGEEVPDADLDRAVAIKLKHFPPAAPPAPATTTVRGLMGPQQIPHVAVPAPTPDQAAAQQGQLLQDLNARYGNPDAPPNPSNVSLGEGGYTAQPPQRGMLSEMGNAFQAGVQGLEAGIGRAGAAVGDVARGLGFDALGAHLQQGRSGGLVPAAGAPSQLPEGTNPAYALAYKGARTFAGFAPVGGAAYLTGGLSGMGGVAGMLAGASPLAAAAGGDGYQAAVDAGLGEHRALQVGLAQAAVAELAGATQLGSVLSKYPWLRQGVQSLAEKRVAEYLAARGADATFQGAVGVAQLAANDAIHVASGLNPGAFENFWTEQAPAAFGENAFIAGAAGGLHDVAALPGAIRQRQQAAQLPAEYAAAREVARQTAPPNTTPAVQVRVEGPPAPVVNPNRPAPPPADGGPAAVAPPAPAGSPDQPTARVPGEGWADFSAAEALAARMAGERPPTSSITTPTEPQPAEVFNPPATSQEDGQSAPAPPAEQPIQVGERVQWTNQGVAQFPEPRKVEGFATWTDGRLYAKLEGSNTMVPVDELGRPAPPPPPPRTQFTPRAPQRPREPAGRPEMGSGRLNIPLTPEMEAQRQQETVNRNVEGWQREKALRDRPVPVPKVPEPTETQGTPQPPAEEPPSTPRAAEPPAADAEGEAPAPTQPPKPSTTRPPIEGAPESPSGLPREAVSSPDSTGRVGPPPAEVAKPPGMPKGEKQPWEMSREDFAQHHLEQARRHAEAQKKADIAAKVFGKDDPRSVELQRAADRLAPVSDIMTIARRDAVQRALEMGKTVPAEVLAEYPDLAPRPEKSRSATQEVAGPEAGGKLAEKQNNWRTEKHKGKTAAEMTTEEYLKAIGGKETFGAGVQHLADAYRSEIEDDRDNYGMRGDSGKAAEDLIDGLQKLAYAEPEPPKVEPPKPAPHPAASDERARVHREVKDAFGDQGEAALPLLDAYARSWTRATGRPAGEFFGRFTFQKGGDDAGSMKQGGGSWYYSAAQKAVEGFKDTKARMTGEQWEKWLRAQPGIKPEELDYLGLPAAKEKMTPAEAAAWIDTNRIKVSETVLGDFTASWEQAKKKALDAGASEEDFRGAYGKFRNWNHDSPEPFPWDDYHSALRDIIPPLSKKRSGGLESKFESYQTPGGTGYRELLLQLPPVDDYATAWKKWATENGMKDAPLGESEKAFQRATGRTASEDQNFRSGHFAQPNILAHVRFNERTDADGKRVLFLEEIQSDWHQKGRERGYKNNNAELPANWKLERLQDHNAEDFGAKPNDWLLVDGDGNDMGIVIDGAKSEADAMREAIASAVDADVDLSAFGGKSAGVPDAPFKTSWPMLAFKRMLHYAVENGYDRIAWTTGEMQADRYDLSKQVDSITVERFGEKYEVRASRENRTVLTETANDAASLEEIIGKDLTKRVVDDFSKYKPNTPDPEAVEAYGKVVKAAQAYLDQDAADHGGVPAFTIRRQNDPDRPFMVMHTANDVPIGSYNNEPEAIHSAANFTRGFRRRDGQSAEADRLYAKYERVYNREWRQRENDGEFAPESREALGTWRPKATYSGLDLKIGGEGMKGFYDQILPAEVNKLVKKMGGRVGQTKIPTGKATVYEGKSHPTPPHTVHALDITPGMKEAAGKGLPLFQNGGENKGSYRLLEDGRAVIRALSNPDASTLPHELGHAFLDFLHEIDPKLHADAMKALGAAGEPTVENHERWSRAFEAYLREGKAPSSILRATFERFKAWLRDVYKSITRGPLAKKLTPALRQVFNEMLTRGDAPESKPREVGKRRSQPVERREWSKADLADRLEHKYTNSPTYQADLSQDHIDLDRGTAGDFSGMYRFPGKIPTELTEALDGRPDLLKLLKANSPGPGAVGADYLGEMGTEKYIRKLEGDTRRRTKDVVESLRRDSADPEAMFLADLWESTPKGGGAPKETVKAEDLAEQGLKFTIDGRNAAIIKKGGDLHLRVKGLGSYPLVAFDEVPVDRGSLARGARGTELHQAAQEPEKTTPKLLDAVTHLAIKTAQRGIRGLKVTERDATVALDRFIGHGEYGPAVTTRAARMANTLLRRSQNKFGGIDPARLEANIGKAYTVAKNRAHREAIRQTEVGRAMEVRAMERKGEAKAEKLKALLTEKGLQAAREMAQEKREARARLIDQADRFLKKGLKERLSSEQRGSVEGYRAGQKDLQAVRREAAGIVMKGLPRGERGRSSVIRAIREATRTRDIYRLVQEVQHRAVSARAGEAWKAIRKATKGKGISGLPEVADGLQPAIADGFRVRDRVKALVKEAKVLKDVAATQKAEPVRLARLLRQRNTERTIIKDPAATPLQKALARDVLREVNGKLRDLRPDLQPKIDAANKLAEISKEIRETRTIVKNADAAWMSNERKSARWLRQNIAGRLEQTKKISITPETKPGVEKKATQTWERQAVFQNWTPDTLGQWMDNAIGDPAKAQFAHHLLFKEPLRAAARVAEEKVQRLAGLDAISKKYGFDSFDHATAVISGTHGGGLQETVDIDVPGWTNKKITLDEALKIFGDDQDEMTRALSDDGMAHVIDRLSNGHATGLDAETRKGIIDAIPKKYRDFYAEVKEFKEKSLGGRPLEIRRRLKGSAPDMVKNREPRIRKSDSDYNHDYFDAQTGSRSLLEQGFMKDRVQNPGAVNVIVGGLENHMKDWDAQLHLIHHADLANTLAKTLIHKDTLKALEVQGGTQASKRVQALVDRILGTELKSRPTALDRAARVLRRNTGAAMTALNPRSFTKQFSVMPLLASLHPREAMAAAARLGERGLRDRVMNSNGLLAQRFHMADAAKAASAGLSNPIFDSGNFWLRMKAAGGNILDAKSQASKLQLRNATKNVMRALGNLRDGTFNALRFNSWADEQGVKLAFLINEQLVDREHPNLAKAEREQLIGERTAELCYRTMNTYDILGQSAWRSDLDQHAILGMANMFSNDGTKQANLLYQAAASGDKGLKARVAAGIGLGSAWSVLAPAAVGLLGGYAWRQIAGGSDTDIEHAKTLKKQLAWSAGREAAGKIPIVGAETLMDLFRGIAEGKNDSAGTSNPAMQSVGQLVHETSLALYNTWSDQDSPDKTDVQNFEASQKKAERRADALNSALRAGGTVAGVGLMPVINLLRSMKPEAEPYGLAANWATRGDEDKAADILAERVAAMQKVGLEDDEIKKHLVEVMTSRLNRDVEKDDRETRLDNAATARRLVSEAMNR